MADDDTKNAPAADGDAGAKASKKDAKASKKDAKGSKKDSKGGKKSDKKSKQGGDGTGDPDRLSIAGHPRASASVRQAKGWGGLAGFGIAVALSIKAATPVTIALERGLLFGLIGYVVAWALSILVWRQLIVAEQRAMVAEVQRRLEERQRQLQAEQSSRKTASARG